ncbi:hypothetical protein PsYK624_029000 [Phanerochaete sordida]|uniref:Uncharacterized protein n=1 Tax=Phanerochaete sordida TaxID=48140 RepID=A0A9P3LAI4_9APHY|nr:hypothetical protein PsYK624_029000 [Phanerochaete sordida]
MRFGLLDGLDDVGAVDVVVRGQPHSAYSEQVQIRKVFWFGMRRWVLRELFDARRRRRRRRFSGPQLHPYARMSDFLEAKQQHVQQRKLKDGGRLSVHNAAGQAGLPSLASGRRSGVLSTDPSKPSPRPPPSPQPHPFPATWGTVDTLLLGPGIDSRSCTWLADTASLADDAKRLGTPALLGRSWALSLARFPCRPVGGTGPAARGEILDCPSHGAQRARRRACANTYHSLESPEGPGTDSRSCVWLADPASPSDGDYAPGIAGTAVSVLVLVAVAVSWVPTQACRWYRTLRIGRGAWLPTTGLRTRAI